MGTPEQAEMNLMVFPLTGNGVAEYDNLSIPFNGSGDAYGTLHIGSYEFLACNKDVNILEDAAPPPPSACVSDGTGKDHGGAGICVFLFRDRYGHD